MVLEEVTGSNGVGLSPLGTLPSHPIVLSSNYDLSELLL